MGELIVPLERPAGGRRLAERLIMRKKGDVGILQRVFDLSSAVSSIMNSDTW